MRCVGQEGTARPPEAMDEALQSRRADVRTKKNRTRFWGKVCLGLAVWFGFSVVWSLIRGVFVLPQDIDAVAVGLVVTGIFLVLTIFLFIRSSARD